MDSSNPDSPPPNHSQSPRSSRKYTPKVNTQGLYQRAIKDAFIKLNPKHMSKNPVMFLVWVGTIITLLVTIAPNLFGPSQGQNPRLFNGLITVILFFTVVFANFAEAVAEGRVKAQADALLDTIARKVLPNGLITEVSSTTLHQGDRVKVIAGDIIPADGEVIAGVAAVDESAITGESAPVLKKPGSDVTRFVIGGTQIISDGLTIEITSDSAKEFIDRMMVSGEGAECSKTSNEIALKVLLAVLTLICVFVVTTLYAIANYVNSPVSVAVLIALLVALIPTTIGGLLSATSIAAINRVAQLNVIATSGRAIEACGDVNTLVLDKTGTITLGNRLAEEFIPVNNHSMTQIANVALAASVFDNTPEGKSIVRLAEKLGANVDFDRTKAEGIEFSAKTHMSGTNLPDGREARKGAVDAIKGFVRSRSVGGAHSPSGKITPELDAAYERVANLGGTPLAVALNGNIYGIIYLKDIVKPGIKKRFGQLRQIGVRTIMLTGDNWITASVIASEVGVDDFIAEATPEDKIAVVQQEQAQGKIVAMMGDDTNDMALAQANVGVAINTSTQAAKEVANMGDFDPDSTKLIDIVVIGKQFLITRGALTTFSIASDIAKYFAIIPVIFASANLQNLNFMGLATTDSAVLSALIYNALIIPALIPLALKGVKFRPLTPNQLLQRNILIYGLGGVVVPFIAIKLIDSALAKLAAGIALVGLA